MGYFNETPVIERLRQAELRQDRETNIRYRDYAETNAVLYIAVPPKDGWWTGRWETEWPVVPKMEERPYGFTGLGWEDMMPRNATTSTPASTTSRRTGERKMSLEGPV